MTNLSKRIDTDDVADLAITLGKLSTAVQNTLAGAGGASPLTTKGDIWVHNATVDTRLAVGANGKFLTAQSGQATGLAWADAPATDLSGYSLTGADTSYLTKIQAFNRTFVNAGILTDTGSGNFTANGTLYYLPMDSTPNTVFASYTVSINTTAVDGTRFAFVFPAGVTALTVQGQGGLAAVANAPTAAIAGQVYEFVFDGTFGAHGTWYRVK